MRPLSKDVQEFIHLLNQERVEYVVVGAWSMAFHGQPRYTGDIDIFLRRDAVNAGRMMQVLQAFGFGQVGLEKSDFLKEKYVIQLGIEPNRIDLLTGIDGIDFDAAWSNRQTGMIAEMPVNFLSRDLLIQNKRAAGRA